MGPISKLVGNGIGMYKESQARKTISRSPSPNPSARNDQDQDYSSDDEDLELQDLDAAQEQKRDSTSAVTTDVDQLLNDFRRKHPPPSYAQSTGAVGHLQQPVILPQRRPEHKDRGFVRAYAPALDQCGIDQQTFLDFLDGFMKAIKGHPYFYAANLAVLGAAMTVSAVAVVSPITYVVASALHTTVELSRRGFIQYQTNKYLATMNEELFKPHGLFCMVMSYKPQSKNPDDIVDFNQNVLESAARKRNKLSSSSGKDMELPESAPLIFPGLDAMTGQQKEELSKMASMADYFDRRAQAQFVSPAFYLPTASRLTPIPQNASNPDSKLPVPQQHFASRYSDPTHSASSGRLLPTLTGGAFDTRLGKRRDARKANRKSNRPVKRMMHQDALYLMVVNMPSQEELARARAEMEVQGRK